ncbi:MAG: tRNA (cytidine(34)-2'-O)-methyltransferase [Pseudohongiellaceae bacterium]
MIHIILYQPEIPPNTGNIIRLAANTGCKLHLVKPFGFELDDKKLRRAGLDYREFCDLRVHENWEECVAKGDFRRIFAVSTKGGNCYSRVRFKKNDAMAFGPETRGLPPSILEALPPEQRLRIPMLTGSRSLNLSNAAAILVYEAWRQSGFINGN